MCGICGVYEYGSSTPALSPALVIEMRDTMAHRGPDDAGVWLSEDRRIGLGHRRLSIVDLSSAGHNPMCNEDGSIWITYNGEIYNHETLRGPLIERGHHYKSRTDTETILHLYEELGLDFVQKLEGFFAIGLWDSGNQTLTLVRDRIGVKPLYYSIANGRLIFASEIKAILAHPSISREMDETALYHYLSFLAIPAPNTLFQGIHKLPAGCMLTCDPSGNTKISRYWDAIVAAPDTVRSEQDYADELYDLLKKSIKKRMMSDVPFGVFLSGGIDSTANVALMAELMHQPVRTFTVGFEGAPEFNELDEARLVAEHYGTNHHEVVIGQKELIDFLPDLIFHQDEPIADPVCVPLHYLSKLARDSGTIVVQVGEGSDELFCGYEDYGNYLDLDRKAWQRMIGMPGPIRRGLAGAGRLALYMGAHRLMRKGKKQAPDMLRRIAAGEELFWTGSLNFDEVKKQDLLTASSLERLRMANAGAPLSSYSIVQQDAARLLAAKPSAGDLERMIYLELKLRLPELLLMRVDKITMANSIEARVPFLDHLLVEFAMTVPSDLKYHQGRTKHILKRALEGRIPDRVLNRKKQGFGAPVSPWLMGALGKFFENSLADSALRRRDVLDYNFIERLFSEHRAGKVNNSFYLWSLLNLSMWYDRWIEGPSPRSERQPALAPLDQSVLAQTT